MNMYMWFSALMAVVLLVSTVAGCVGVAPAALEESTAAQYGELVLEASAYEMNGESFAADVGVLTVPENRDNPDSRLIELPVIRVRALGDSPAEPIFTLAGGPGGFNMRFSRLNGLIDNHDIVMVGYRGVDGSVVLDCSEVVEAMRGIGNDLYGDQSAAGIGDAFARCAARLQDEGVDLEGYTMPEVVEDMEAARIALGYARINPLSQSYGTRVAMIYSWTHPESIYRSAMIAVNPPGHFVWEPDIVDAQIAYDADLCAQDAECSARTDDLAETMRNVAHDLPDQWQGLPIDPGKVKMMTHFGLFNRGSAAMVYDAYLTAEEGDPSGLAFMSQMYDSVVPGMFMWGDFAAKGGADYDPTGDYLTEMNPPDSIIGAPATLLGGFAVARESWPINTLPAELRQVQPSDVETLLVGGSVDFSTPSQFATDEFLPFLSNGEQVILSEFGHTGDVWSMQPEATIRLLTSFFDTGVADDSLYTYQPMDFHVEIGFPEMAKQQ
jgi:pimeloyl-ACP methyl ester carboxylesterase